MVNKITDRYHIVKELKRERESDKHYKFKTDILMNNLIRFNNFINNPAN